MTENIQPENNQDLLTDVSIDTIRRRNLLPLWIKIFCWFFMLSGVMTIVCLVPGIFGIKPYLAFYGFKTNDVFSLNGLIVISVGILKGITAFSLWFEKDNAIKIAKIDTYIGLLLCGISMLVLPFFAEGIKISIRLEPALLIPFLMKMNKIQEKWENRIK